MSENLGSILRSYPRDLALTVLLKCLEESCSENSVYISTVERMEKITEKVKKLANNEYRFSTDDVKIIYLYLLLKDRLPLKIIKEVSVLSSVYDDVEKINSTHEEINNKTGYITSLITLTESILEAENKISNTSATELLGTSVMFREKRYDKDYDTTYSEERNRYIKIKPFGETVSADLLKPKPIMLTRYEAEDYCQVNSKTLSEAIATFEQIPQKKVSLKDALSALPDDVLINFDISILKAFHRDRLNWIFCKIVRILLIEEGFDKTYPDVMNALRSVDIAAMKKLQLKYEKETSFVILHKTLQKLLEYVIKNITCKHEPWDLDRLISSFLKTHEVCKLRQLLMEASGDFSEIYK